MKPYRIVDIGAAQQGMRLYGDLRDRGGQLLLPQGSVLTGATIASLRRRGVELLTVIDDSATAPQLAIARERALARIAYLFRHAGSGAANGFLRDVVEAYRMAELA